MANISIHNVVDINIRQEIVSDKTDNLGTYGIITINTTSSSGEKEEITLYGNNEIMLPNIILKDK